MSGIHERIDNWFTFHPPRSQQRRDAHVEVRDACRQVAHVLAARVPACDELKFALDHLRAATMWANAGLALSPDQSEPLPADLVGTPPPFAYDQQPVMVLDGPTPCCRTGNPTPSQDERASPPPAAAASLPLVAPNQCSGSARVP